MKPRRLKNKLIVLENTCAFDSVLQGLAVCICDSNTYSTLVDRQGGMLQLASGIVTRFKPHKLYQQLLTILEPHYPAEILENNLIRVKCATTAMDVVSKFIPASLSEIKQCSSPFCPEKTTSRNFPLVRVESQFLAENGIASLEEAIERGSCINNNNERIKCMKQLPDPTTVPEIHKHFDPDISKSVLCYGNVAYKQTAGPNGHIIIEFASDDLKQQPANQVIDFETTASFNLAQIPNHVSLSGKNFHLRAVVAFSPPLVSTGIGHYVAYCKRSDGG